MNKKILTVIGVLVIAGILAGSYWYFSFNDTSAGIALSGNIEVDDIDISFEVPGKVASVPVEEGESVKKGEVVARLEKKDYKREVELKKAKLQAAKAHLKELQNGTRKEKIKQAEAALDSALADFKSAKDDYERFGNLHEEEVISGREFEKYKTRYLKAKSAVKNAREHLNLLKIGPRREKIDAAKAKYREAKTALKLAKNKLEDTVLRAPVDGRILSDNIQEGEYVHPGTPVMTLGNLRQIWLRVYLPETELGKVKYGQPAEITTDTYSNKTYAGKVIFISSEAEFTPKQVHTPKERVKLVYRIKIAVENKNLELKPGMPADAVIKTR